MFYQVGDVKKNFLEVDGNVYFLSKDYTPEIYINQKITSIANEAFEIYAGQWTIRRGKKIEEVISKIESLFWDCGITDYKVEHNHFLGKEDGSGVSDAITISWVYEGMLSTRNLFIYTRS